jgi:hypothetical protein
MLNNKQKRYLTGLYENFGQLFDNENAFRKYFFDTTAQKYTAMLYNEEENELQNNYKAVKAPAEIPEFHLNY